jgi:uncharacterized protein YodC (DUF2158 family)
MWNKIRTRLFGPKSKFKLGDSVEIEDGGSLMVVIEVITNSHLKEPILNCKWYDEHTKSDRTNLFSESKLKPFDWHKANRRTDWVVNKFGKIQVALERNISEMTNSNNSQTELHHLNDAT